MRRYTFVVQVHPDGVSTLENLSTSERTPIEALSEVGPQIERWLAEKDEISSGPRMPEAPTGPAPG